MFLAWVCGAAGSGKTSLLRHLVRKPYKEAYMPTSKPINVVNSVEIDGSEKYLVVSTKFRFFGHDQYGMKCCGLINCDAVARVWVEIRSGDTSELQKDRIG